MADKKTILIESILGGHAPTSHFAARDQFRSSVGIDPSLPVDDNSTVTTGFVPSGLLRPMSVYSAGTTVAVPMWIEGNPKQEGTLYVYDNAGSVYTVNDAINTVTGLADLNDGGSAFGGGMAYYDNYMYFARATTVARYGPLNGTPAWTDDYWTTTLSKAALSDTDYPVDFDFTIEYPNHIMHRHSDGKLYFADVVDNKGTIHYIQTSKGTVEGDTDAGSTHTALQVGYGLWPTAIESYGSDLAISFIEVTRASGSYTLKSTRAKLAFWDTTSTNVNKITWVEYPDQMITGLKNVNGTLYVVSSNQYVRGFRVTKFIGGYTFQEAVLVETGQAPFPGAIDGTSDRLLFGSWSESPESMACVYSYGLQRGLSNGIFNVISARSLDSDGGYTQSSIITALKMSDSSWQDIIRNYPILGISRGAGLQSHGIMGVGAYNTPSVWWSQTYRIGQPFKITKISIPLATPVTTNTIVTPTIWTDDGNGSAYTLTPINNTNDSTKQYIVRRAGASGQPLTGQSNFWLELRWSGTALCTVGLPITIEYELLDD